MAPLPTPLALSKAAPHGGRFSLSLSLLAFARSSRARHTHRGGRLSLNTARWLQPPRGRPVLSSPIDLRAAAAPVGQAAGAAAAGTAEAVSYHGIVHAANMDYHRA